MYFKRILITLDGTKTAEKTLPVAELMASYPETELLLVSICDPKPKITDERQKYLDAKSAELRTKGIQANGKMFCGELLPLILKCINENGIDLLCMASHGYTGIKKMVLGSVSEKLIKATNLPVLLVKEGHDPDKAVFANILLPLDGSLFSEACLKQVSDLARDFKSKLTLLVVIQPPCIPSDRSPSIQPSWDEYYQALLEELKQQAQAYLERLTGELQANGIETEFRMEVSDKIPETILSTAEDINASLISFTTHNRSGIEKWYYGSVAAGLIENSSHPMLLWRNSI
ncbi:MULTISPECIES: universal stress protein [Dehalococcoides]|jgi:Universal stress protein UspA and related nucleotide-binding proteins|uniref:Universal stress protein n=1 Tax=Dehalococcoides mccartyi TaxID=61435 RepID=A0A142VAZ8_9CHLR|nr:MULTISPECIES: universal stress protein [Dehalococcoides]AGG06271.1 universal stress protein [Dehalococcoides mccartyi DCMB5]AII60736.1 universal stress protein [Dehalococcoides mccartyi CG5]AMU86405.1 universal stress protein [Dehalococcoides mccartyi]AOV99233.1 universal stress protein [Dehalococcoides mccartyi]AQU05718.1 universal stress protein [Dehalococcoides mccartyi]